MYNLSLESLSYAASGKALKALFVDRDYVLSIDDLGTGMRVAFRLLLCLLLSRGSAVLAEEIDGYQDGDSFPRLVAKLIELAIAHDVQLFVTTHRLDTIATLLDADRDHGSSQVGLFRRA